MVPLQEVNFHLNSGEVIFAHLTKIDGNDFTAEVTSPHPIDNLPPDKFFTWLACPGDANAEAAFREIVEAINRLCLKTPEKKLVKVNNPCNCEFLSVAAQERIVGLNVQVTINEPI